MFSYVCRVHTKLQVMIKMCKFNMFITAVCVLFLIKTLSRDVKSSMSLILKHSQHGKIYIRPIYIDRANCAYEARKPRREPLRNSGTITRSLKQLRRTTISISLDNSLFSRDVMYISKYKIAEPLNFHLSLVIEHPKYISF